MIFNSLKGVVKVTNILHPSHPFSWLLLGPAEPLPVKGAERGSLTHMGLNKTSTQWGGSQLTSHRH